MDLFKTLLLQVESPYIQQNTRYYVKYSDGFLHTILDIILLEVVQFSVQFSQSFRQKDLF